MLKQRIEPFKSNGELRTSLEQMLSILDMADAEPKPIVAAGLLTLAEDHGEAMMRRLRPFVKARIDEVWPTGDEVPNAN